MTFRGRLLATLRAIQPVLGLLLVSADADLAEFSAMIKLISPEARHVIDSNLSILSLLPARAGMPDPTMERARVNALVRLLAEGKLHERSPP